MIQLTDVYSTERDKYQWILYETTEGVNTKNGEPITRVYTTFHGKLSQVLDQVVERSSGDCESIQELLTMISNCTTILSEVAMGVKG